MIIKKRSQPSFILASTLFLASSFSFADETSSKLVIKGTSVQAPLALGALSVIHNKDEFSVVKDGITSRVQTHCLDKSLRGISQSKLKNLLASNGYLCVNQASDGQYLLEASGRLNGGGPIFGLIVGGLVRFVGYGGLALTATPAAGVASTGVVEAVANQAQVAVSFLPWCP